MSAPGILQGAESAAARAPRKVVSKSSLAIIERAYRGSLEEQYGHIVWLTRVMKGMGAATALLLKGDTVMYARRGQPRMALAIGDLTVSDVSHYESSIEELLRLAVPVYAWQPDLARLQLGADSLIEGVVPVGDADMLSLIQRFDCVWYW